MRYMGDLFHFNFCTCERIKLLLLMFAMIMIFQVKA